MKIEEDIAPTPANQGINRMTLFEEREISAKMFAVPFLMDVDVRGIW